MPDSQNKLSVYSASAGSGKTYTIAYEYISMMLHVAEKYPYRNILAVTFTNKASAEMKSRIILNLYQISHVEDLRKKGNDVSKIDAIIDKIKERTQLGKSEIISRSKTFFSLILHEYSFFSIMTIDSFFQKIVRNLTYELDMQQNYELELDTNLIISQLVDDLMLKAETDNELKENIEALIESNLENDKKWSPKDAVKNFVTQAVEADYKNENDIEEYTKILDGIINSFCDSFRSFMKKISDLINANGLAKSDFTGGWANYYYYETYSNDKGSNAKLAEILFEKKYSEDKFKDNKWFNKSSANLHLLPDFKLITDELKKLDFTDFCTAYIIKKNINLIRLLGKATEMLHENLERDSVFLLSDVPSLLSEIINSTGKDVMPFVFEKVGTTYNNFLIDEFQDTSQKQWNIFNVMLQEALSQANRSIIVGDIKQSIYSWRGGDWKILSGLTNEQIFGNFVKPERLKTNFRTAKNIVEFNNDFFKTLFESNYESLFGSENSTLYRDVVQEVNDQQNSEIKIRIYSSNEKKSDERNEILTNQIFNDMVAQIEVLQQNGVQPNQITILTRKQKEAKILVKNFLEYNERKEGICYDVVSNEALFIVSNRAVRLILAYMRHLLNPEDDLSLTEAAFLYDLEEKKIVDTESFNHTTLVSAFENAIDSQNKPLTDKQSFEIVDILISRLKLDENQANIPFLIAFRNVVHDFSAKSTDLQAFMDYWNERGEGETLKIPESQNAIKIITIHKSKGLEADYIFIPFCDWKYIDKIPGATEYLFVKDCYSKEGIIPVELNSNLEKTRFAKDYNDDINKKRIEAFNLLYVAFTRAKFGLYVSARKDYSETKNISDRVSDLLEAYFTNLPNDWKKDEFEGKNFKRDEYTKGCLTFSDKNKKSAPSDNFIKNYPVHEGSEFEIIHHLRDDIEGEFSAREKGNLYHSIFENIYTENDVESAVKSLMINGEIDSETTTSLINEISDKLKNENINRWFSKSCEVINELPIINPKAEKQKRPDRVMIFDDEIVILDYKFGTEKQDSKYSKQVREYAKLISEMKDSRISGKKISMYIWYYFRNEIVKIGQSKDEEIINI